MCSVVMLFYIPMIYLIYRYILYYKNYIVESPFKKIVLGKAVLHTFFMNEI